MDSIEMQYHEIGTVKHIREINHHDLIVSLS